MMPLSDVARCAPKTYRLYCQECYGGRLISEMRCKWCDGVGMVLADGHSILNLNPCVPAQHVDAHPSFVTITHGIRGYFAVLLVWNPEFDGFYEPENSGIGSYATAAEAEPEALEWAQAEGVAFRLPRSKRHCGRCGHEAHHGINGCTYADADGPCGCQRTPS
jgi:hypothetical protein